MGIERRVNPSWSLAQLKDHLYPVLGVPPQYQSLQSAQGPVVVPDQARIEEVLYDGADLFVHDTNPFGSAPINAAEGHVAKYQIDEETYLARPDNFRRFRQNLEQQDPGGHFRRRNEQRQETRELMVAAAAALSVGERCEVVGGRRGQIRFVGEAPGRKPGLWVGIDLDEPTGGNDSLPLFESKPNSALWLRPDQVQQGDFPERDPFDDKSDDEL